MACIEARGLRKVFGTTIALDNVDLGVEEGRILGLIGPNGAGKTTALNAILGLTSYEGELKVLGRDPWSARGELMRDVSFIADVAVLPRWIRVTQVLECSMEEFEARYAEVMVHPDHVTGARSLKPMHERQVFGRSVMLFENVDRGQLAALGEVRTPSIADLFVAVMSNRQSAIGSRQ